ncbi:DUF952 domain-containing protein [Gordonia pseudamarae]|jgi:uncharacterized protein (DUF952 family)|uniref:DUF952 domain-containing protein n=1 Tax=Gordonia pseudamarae TaxID=2831662 RepID=A0ABX6IFI2_9ACTN|nr:MULTISPECIES: DUF952 domain-containing protein [Gordonia]MBD0021568.1 DUF952 domain-containing protein [Gordonia sp. (in: high G+C Gram-positive bacteria)]QHN25146.1 DUF952 domain-containing protein [Gordonia pseudamarae]QHN34079.1 DUF952 domain-containing protein [Gordonia pseudamarae]
MTTPEGPLLHLCTTADWSRARAAGHVDAPSLTEVGFIHLSAPHQVHLPANRLFAGRTDLVALRIDPALLRAEIRWEPGVPTDPDSMLFPHLYGRLPVSAITSAEPFVPADDGTFAPLPEAGRVGSVANRTPLCGASIHTGITY